MLRKTILCILFLLHLSKIFPTDNELIWLAPPVSLHNTEQCSDIIKRSYNTLRNLAYPTQNYRPSIENCCRVCNTYSSSQNYCHNKNHIRRTLIFYSTLFGEGVIFGAKSFIILHYLYSLGVYQAGTQLAINFLTTEVCKFLLREKSHDSNLKKYLRQLLAIPAKRSIKIGLLSLFPNIDPNLLFEPNKMHSLITGTLLHYEANISTALLIDICNKELKKEYIEYNTVKSNKNNELYTQLAKGVGFFLGISLGQSFFEDSVHNFADYLSEQIITISPSLKPLISLTT